MIYNLRMSLKESGKYKSLDFLKFEEVLNENPENPSITILAKDENDEKAVILLRKKPFQERFLIFSYFFSFFRSFMILVDFYSFLSPYFYSFPGFKPISKPR